MCNHRVVTPVAVIVRVNGLESEVIKVNACFFPRFTSRSNDGSFV